MHQKIWIQFWPPPHGGGSFKEENRERPKKSNTKICFLPPSPPPSKFFVFALFPTFQRKEMAEHKEFQRLKAPKNGGFGHGILGEIFVFGCLFGPEERLISGNAKNYLPPPPESKIELWVPQVYGRYPNLGKHSKIISTIAFLRLAKIRAPRWW